MNIMHLLYPKLINIRKWVSKFSAEQKLKKYLLKNLENLYHPKSLLAALPGKTSRTLQPSGSVLVGRIVQFYRRVNAHDQRLGKSMWHDFTLKHHATLNYALMSGNMSQVENILSDPANTNLFYGFDNLIRHFSKIFENEVFQRAYAINCLDNLLRFAEATNCVPLWNPESKHQNVSWTTESIITVIENTLEWDVKVPNIFPNEHGLLTSKGILSQRVPQALYQAWRLSQLCKNKSSPRILEIGAGLGRTAFYAHNLGLRDYTIVDIPTTLVSQSYFLGRALGEENIKLGGEVREETDTKKVKIIDPNELFNSQERYDIILNVDSLTEIDTDNAKKYYDYIKSYSNIFLSINHESNSFTVDDLIHDHAPIKSKTRVPYWLRKGYVESLIEFHS